MILESVGETAANNVIKFLSYTTEQFKSLNANEFVENVTRTVRGMFTKCITVEQCVFQLVRSVARAHLPHSGRTFLDAIRNPMCKGVVCHVSGVINWATKQPIVKSSCIIVGIRVV